MELVHSKHNLVKESLLSTNADDISNELDWFESVLQMRSAINAGSASPKADIFSLTPPDLSKSKSSFAKFIKENALQFEDRFLLFMAMVPQIKPECLDIFLVQNQRTGQIYTEFGGRRGKIFNGFLPTAETFLFVLAGGDLQKRFKLLQIFDARHPLFSLNVLDADVPEPGDPITSLPLQINKNWFELFTTGEESTPRFNNEFPAQKLITDLQWEDLILPAQTSEQLNQIEIWLQHHTVLMDEWGMRGRLKPGFRALFHGLPGTGKSLAATLLGNRFGKSVYRIDLSKVVSKYIGETEKNLAKVFDRAENRGWILFFDEADALFGKRTQVSSSNDKYANQETSFLLQRVEDYNGLVILASNFKHNMDDAFIRRFQSVVDFTLPGPAERLQIWQKGFSEKAQFEDKMDLKELAHKHEISGGVIMNVIQYSSLQALKRGDGIVRNRDIINGIKFELRKSGRTM